MCQSPIGAPDSERAPDWSALPIHPMADLSDITRTSKTRSRSLYFSFTFGVSRSQHRLRAPTANRTTRLTSWSPPQSTLRLNSFTTESERSHPRVDMLQRQLTSRP